jgi:energy-coupling factor transporter ATP-binding protein EcfA2
MLTRLYIDNFRCFEKFEWRPGRKQLILGRNGTGKTSVSTALVCVREVAQRGERVELVFASSRARWMDQTDQVFEIEAQLKGGAYVYRLVIEHLGEPARPRVRFETLHCNEMLILRFEDGKVATHPADGTLPSAYNLDQSRPAISTASVPGLPEFRDWLSTIWCSHINPFSMGSHAEGEVIAPRVDLANFAGWYRHLVQAHPGENTAFLRDLGESLDGFKQLRLAHAGENVRVLYAEFLRDGKTVSVGFSELSDGQRCLICLYAVMHFAVAKGGTVIIDEPDNFISLREIQPWLMAIEDMADDHKGQVILISHHPEILNQWAGPYGVQFIRDGAGPVRVEKFKGDPESSLTAAELVARGWDLE